MVIRRMIGRFDVAKAAFAASCLVLAFGFGIVVGRYEVFPYRAIEAGKDALDQVAEEASILIRQRPDKELRVARHAGAGVTQADTGRMAPGLTFLTGFFGDGFEGRLLRPDGTLLHRWPIRFSDAFPEPDHIEPEALVPTSDWNIEPHGALLLPDGAMLFNFEYGGLVKLERCGSIEWTVPRMTHHSLEPAAGGGFWVPDRRVIADSSPYPELQPPFYEEMLLRVSATGEVLDSVSLPRLLFENGLRALFFSNVGMASPLLPPGPNRLPLDLTHLNDIEELSGELAGRFPSFEAGDLLLSLRDLNLVMVVNPRTWRVRWRRTGPWIAQHDPDFGADGTITVFDNNRDGTADGTIFGGSQILAADPVAGTVWQRYAAPPGERFYSQVRGKHQQLDNGNLLIVETEAGRVFEVDSSGAVVWEFVNRYDEETVALVYDALRYRETYFTVGDWRCDGAPTERLEGMP